MASGAVPLNASWPVCRLLSAGLFCPQRPASPAHQVHPTQTSLPPQPDPTPPVSLLSPSPPCPPRPPCPAYVPSGAAAAVPQVTSVCTPVWHRKHHCLHNAAVQVSRAGSTGCQRYRVQAGRDWLDGSATGFKARQRRREKSPGLHASGACLLRSDSPRHSFQRPASRNESHCPPPTGLVSPHRLSLPPALPCPAATRP